MNGTRIVRIDGIDYFSWCVGGIMAAVVVRIFQITRHLFALLSLAYK